MTTPRSRIEAHEAGLRHTGRQTGFDILNCGVAMDSAIAWPWIVLVLTIALVVIHSLATSANR